MIEVSTVLVPSAPKQIFVEKKQLTLESLQDRVIGFIDNAKPNFKDLVDDLEQILIAKYGARKVIKLRKRAASIPAPTAYIDQLAGACDLVITGSGD
jgi:hypothetical protein